MVPLVLTALLILALDGIWLTYRAAYHRQVFATIQGHPLEFRLAPAVGAYTIMILGVWFFAVRPAISWSDAALRGAALGLLMYGLYDLTNYATLSRYPLHYVLSDMAWGTVLCAGVAAGAFAAAKYIPGL
jgi:uncharacterized membrane protein